MIYVLMLIVVIACFLQRLSMTWRIRFSFDSWGHYYFLQSVKRQKTGPFAPINVNVLEGGMFHYPLLTHWLLSLLPHAILNRWISVVNPMFEAIGLAFYLALCVAAELNTITVAAAGIAYVFTPMLFSKVAIGPTSHFTTRLYSELTAGLLLLLAFLPLPVSTIVLFPLMAILVAYIVLSSKFGLQMTLLVILPVSLFAWKPALIIGLIFGFLLAVVLSKGNIINSFRSQAHHLRWYLGEVQKKNVSISTRNGLAPFLELATKRGLKNKLIYFAFALAGRNSFTALAIKFPTIIIIVYLLWNNSLSGPVVANGFSILFCIAMLVYMLVNTTFLIILGEAERYLNHFAFLSVLVFTEWAFSTDHLFLFYCVVGWGVVYWLAELVLLGFLRLNQPYEDENKAYDQLLMVAPAESIVLSYPYHVLSPWRLLASSNLRPIFPIIGTGPGTARLKAMEKYPFIDLSHLPELRCDFGLAYIVTQDEKLTDEGKAQLEADGWKKTSGRKISGISIYHHTTDGTI